MPVIEGVQRRATKLHVVESVTDLDYMERLKLLGLTRIDTRRDRGDLILKPLTFCLAYNVNRDLFFVMDDGGRWEHSKKLFIRRCRLDIRKFLFRNRIVDNWNRLSDCLQLGEWTLYGGSHQCDSH